MSSAGKQEKCKVCSCIDCSWIHSFIHGNLLFTFFYEQVQESLNYRSEKGRRKDSFGVVLGLCDRSYNI
jgi:hypothetical protein